QARDAGIDRPLVAAATLALHLEGRQRRVADRLPERGGGEHHRGEACRRVCQRCARGRANTRCGGGRIVLCRERILCVCLDLVPVFPPALTCHDPSPLFYFRTMKNCSVFRHLHLAWQIILANTIVTLPQFSL